MSEDERPRLKLIPGGKMLLRLPPVAPPPRPTLEEMQRQFARCEAWARPASPTPTLEDPVLARLRQADARGDLAALDREIAGRLGCGVDALEWNQRLARERGGP